MWCELLQLHVVLCCDMMNCVATRHTMRQADGTVLQRGWGLRTIVQ